MMESARALREVIEKAKRKHTEKLCLVLRVSEVDGSSPFRPIQSKKALIKGNDGGLAQMGERLLCTQEVIGSIPLASIET